MNEPSLVSVIIPIYKVEPYLCECVDSIIAQTYKNLEIILVDDGSPDKCPEICDGYAKQDGRIKVIHKLNGGLSDARNAGIGIATGEYLCFVDSDDVVHFRMIETLMKPLIFNKDLKMSACQCLNFNDGDTFYISQEIEPSVILDYKVFLTIDHWSTAWCKIYKYELFKKTKYPIGRIHEDEFITHKICYDAKNIAYTKSQLLFYRQRKGSIMNAKTLKGLVDVHDALKGQVDFFLEKKETEPYAMFLLRFVLFYSYNKYYKKILKDSENLFVDWKTEIKKYSIKQLSFKQKMKYIVNFRFPRIRFFWDNIKTFKLFL